MKIPGTSPAKAVPHYVNFRRLSAYEKATGVRISGSHATLMDWLLPATGALLCEKCDQLGVLMRGPVWIVCPYCEGAVWKVSPSMRRKLRWWVSARFPDALV
jgi:hypothetical protein